MARRGVEAADLELRKDFEAHARKSQPSAAVATGQVAGNLAVESQIMVCQMDEEAMKNPRMREIINPFKPVINTLLPLTVVRRWPRSGTSCGSNFPMRSARSIRACRPDRSRYRPVAASPA
jgi:hypothetical protein